MFPRFLRSWLERPTSPKPRTPLLCEAFEDRSVPAIIPPFPVSDVSQIAALYPRHAGATDVYLNFDGWDDRFISEFESVSGNRSRDIQEIIFRASELFAPFDVQVHRIAGDGKYANSNGATTIFIGDKLGNTDWFEQPGGGWTLTNRRRAYAESIDGPTLGNGLIQPNGHAYDLAFVDPVSFKASSTVNGGQPTNVSVGSISGIAYAIGHEAGHTFGLGHVLSGNNPEMMSYSAINLRFMNKSFEITTLNDNGTTTEPEPSFQPFWLWDPAGPGGVLPAYPTTQNSYAYLKAALGSRPADFANVANIYSTDPAYVQGAMPSLAWNGGNEIGSVNRLGDYDVFTVQSPGDRWLVVNVKTPNSNADTVVFVTNDSGNQTLAYDDDSGVGTDSRVIFRAEGGTTYKIAVGSYNGNSTGEYQITVNEFNPVVNPSLDNSIGDLTFDDPQRDITPLVVNRVVGTRESIAQARVGQPAVLPTFLPESSSTTFAPPAGVAASIGLVGGNLNIGGTNLNDLVDVRYVSAPTPSAPTSIAPAPWIRVMIDTPFGDSTTFYPTASVFKINFAGFAGNDGFQNATLKPSVSDGGLGNDILITGGGNDIAAGGQNNDLIFGAGGADYLAGNANHDILFGGTGTDHLIGDEVGQTGNDILFGEADNDVLEGRDGNDFLFGGVGRDLLIGGRGTDNLDGGLDDDLLIGGSISFAILGTAVEDIAIEWFSAHTYAERINNIRGWSHPTFDLRLNDETFLKKGTTVIDDGDPDNIVGGAGQDWYWVDPLDTTDAVGGEFVS